MSDEKPISKEQLDAIGNQIRASTREKLAELKNSEKSELLLEELHVTLEQLFPEDPYVTFTSLIGRCIMDISLHLNISPTEAGIIAVASWCAFCAEDDPKLQAKLDEVNAMTSSEPTNPDDTLPN